VNFADAGPVIAEGKNPDDAIYKVSTVAFLFLEVADRRLKYLLYVEITAIGCPKRNFSRFFVLCATSRMQLCLETTLCTRRHKKAFQKPSMYFSCRTPA
jgi:hypothetical protein